MRRAIAFERERRRRCGGGRRVSDLREVAVRWGALRQGALRKDLHRAVLVAARKLDMPRLIALEHPGFG